MVEVHLLFGLLLCFEDDLLDDLLFEAEIVIDVLQVLFEVEVSFNLPLVGGYFVEFVLQDVVIGELGVGVNVELVLPPGDLRVLHLFHPLAGDVAAEGWDAADDVEMEIVRVHLVQNKLDFKQLIVPHVVCVIKQIRWYTSCLRLALITLLLPLSQTT